MPEIEKQNIYGNLKNQLADEVKNITEKVPKLHPLRSSVAIWSLLYLHHTAASWSELKSFIESVQGQLNSNTLRFHLSQLEEGGFVKFDEGCEKYELTPKGEDAVNTYMVNLLKLLGKSALDSLVENSKRP